jgi:mRNA interferase RelE/StbE
MAFQILITRRAENDLKKLDLVVKKKIKKKIILLAKDPASVSKKLKNSPVGEYRYRIGNYRVVFDVSGRNIIILRVGHRREIYKK